MLDVNDPYQLVGQDPYALFQKLCEISNKQYDPCLLDVFISAVSYMEGAPCKRWWDYTEERKKKLEKHKKAIIN